MGKKSNHISNREIPDRLLINKDDVNIICKNYISKERWNNVIGILIGIVTSLVLVFFTNKITWKEDAFIIIITAVSSTLLVFFMGLRFVQYRNLDLLQDIYDLVIQNSDHTAVFLIGDRHIDNIGNEQIELLTEKHGEGAKFLVYLAIEEGEGEKDIRKKLAAKLEVREKLIKIKHLDSYSYIKRTQIKGKEKLIRYEFFETKIDKNVEKNIVSKYEWVNFAELKSDVTSQISNHDVIEYIENHLLLKIPKSFVSFEKERPIKIIWNITQKCDYQCDICATASSKRRELTQAEKAAALLSIISIPKSKIRELDFSGGDPLSDAESRKIIKYAINELGREKVYVTTTGKGIEKANKENESLEEILYNCEITIEENSQKTSRRGSEDYSINNLYTINAKYTDKIHNLIINVPIINPDMEEDEIRQLVKSLSEVKVYNKQIVLIRLMKVGKMKDNYPESYNPSKFIEYFKKYANEFDLSYRLQCALRGRYEDQNCNMLSEKIGIDCEGNVFACAWGGYIVEDVNKNPFYLGNLRDKDLQEILAGERAYKMKRQIAAPSKQCRVFCTLAKEQNQLEDCGDILFSQEEKKIE